MFGEITTAALAQMLSGELVGRPDLRLADLTTLEDAGPETLSFIRSAEYAARWRQSRAAAALVTRGVDVPGHDPDNRALIYVDSADHALVTLLERLSAAAAPPPPPPGVHPSAVVDPEAKIDPTAAVGPLCAVGAGAAIGPGVVLHARVTVGRDSRVGEKAVLHPGVVLYPASVIGRRCTLHANVSIGADGFGYIPHPNGRGHIKIPHLGNVVIGDDVEIGAGTCIDKAKFGSTTVGDGTKIDNLVQVGHNVSIGRHVLICANVGIAGSAKIGDGVILAGQVGVGDNVSIGPGARVGGQAGVTKSLPAGGLWWGTPIRPMGDILRSQAAVASLVETLRDLKKRLAALERAAADPEP